MTTGTKKKISKPQSKNLLTPPGKVRVSETEQVLNSNLVKLNAGQTNFIVLFSSEISFLCEKISCPIATMF